MTAATSNSRFSETMRENARRRFRDVTIKLFKSRPAMSGSEYADKFGVLIDGGKVQRWKTYPFQREILDAFVDPVIPEVVVMKSARMGISECLNHAIQYKIHWEPCDIGMYRPKDADAERYMEKRFDPRARAVPDIKSLMFLSSGGKRTEKRTERSFKNGASLMVLGAESEDNLRDHTLKFIALDELDAVGFAPTKGGGNKYDMARRRGYQFWDSKVIAISTPKFPAASGGRVHALFLESDQRHFYVQCPHCAHEFTPEWGSKDAPGGMRWNPEDPSEVWYECPENGCVIEHHDKKGMVEKGRWIPHQPEVKSRRGYYMNQIISYAPKASWQAMVREWLEACKSGQAQIQSFKNEVLGLPFHLETGEAAADHEALLECVVDYGGEVPDWCEVLTAGVDVQKGSDDGSKSYFEASVYAWGKGGRSALIGHWILDEHPLTSQAAWDALESTLTQSFTDSSGRGRRVESVCIDSHGGFSQRVYSWIESMRKKGRRRWYAVRGANNAPGTRKETIWPKAAAKKNGILFTIDVSLAKDELALALSEGKAEFPAVALPGAEEMNAEFFKRLTREKAVPVDGRPGATRWTTPSDQEPWDCLVYAYSATHALRAMPGGQKYKRALAEERRAVSSEEDTRPLSERAAVSGPRHEPEPEPAQAAKPGLVRVRPRLGWR